MGIELAIANLAISEARSTGEAQLLVAKHRFELEQTIQTAREKAGQDQPASSFGPIAAPAPPGTLYQALDAVKNKAAPVARTAHLDKTA